MTLDLTLVVRRLATGVAWWSVGVLIAIAVADVTRAQAHDALLPLLLTVPPLAFLSVKDSIERYVDAKAGKMIAEQVIAELTLKATEDAVRTGHYRVDARLERQRAVN